jgi:DNA modification methylase
MMKPYYEHAGITIYHGDCDDVLEVWEGRRSQSFDLLLTDPPYGIGIHKSPRLAISRGFVDSWDNQTLPEQLMTAKRFARHAIVWGGNYYDLGPCRGFLIWDKQNDGMDFADCELAWTTFDKVARIIRKRPMNMDGGTVHPTQKPEEVIRWSLLQAPQSQTILDPFMGSGTTLVAAKRLGKQATGIEREERYCEIAAQRLQQEALPLEILA